MRMKRLATNAARVAYLDPILRSAMKALGQA